MKLCVLSTILVSCFAFYNASTIRESRSTIATISYENSCDVYLIVNFLLILHKQGTIDHNLSTNELTPLGLLSSQIEIQKVNDLSFVWNPRTAKVIFIIQTTQLNSLYTDIVMTFKMNAVNWEVLLNELIGVNNIPMSQKSIEIFKYLSQMLATALGVETPPYALLHLNGLIIISTSLSGKDCGTTTFLPINELIDITDNKLLAKEIARCSLIIDTATYWNSKFQFSNCACLLHTSSDYATSPLIGDLRLAENLENAVSGLLNIYTNEEIRDILIKILIEHVAYCDIGETLSYIFDDQNLEESDDDDESEMVFLQFNVESDSEKCTIAPEIEEVTTVTTAETQQETTTEEVTTTKPRIYTDTTTEADSGTAQTQTEEANTTKTDDETTLMASTTSTTTDAPTTTTTTIPTPTTTDSATREPDDEELTTSEP